VIGYAVADEEVPNRWHLHWTASLQGDFNLDGAVNIADVTRLAQNFGIEVGEDPYLREVMDRFQPFGTVGIEDITSVAWYYGSQISGFMIEVKTDPYAEASSVYTVELDDSISRTSALAYELVVDTGPYDYYVVVGAIANEAAERLFYVQDEIHLIP